MHLLKKYNAHINVEWCNKSNMIKYLFKYVTKGSDRAKVYFDITAKMTNASPCPQLALRNEIQEYIDARFLSCCEALRAFEFDIHFRVPAVENLTVHLPGMNFVRYEPDIDLRALLDSPKAKNTMLTKWFEANSKHEEARYLTYCDFPKEWSWSDLLGNSGKPVTLETLSLTKFSKHVFQGQGIRDFRKPGTCEASNSRMCEVRES
jgi:hypothetical protein